MRLANVVSIVLGKGYGHARNCKCLSFDVIVSRPRNYTELLTFRQGNFTKCFIFRPGNYTKLFIFRRGNYTELVTEKRRRNICPYLYINPWT